LTIGAQQPSATARLGGSFMFGGEETAGQAELVVDVMDLAGRI
jgi:hypothetical protein